MRKALLALALLAWGAAPAGAADFKTLLKQASQARAAGQIEQALIYLEEAYYLDQRPELLNNMATLLEGLGRFAEAAERYKQVIDDPKAPGALKVRDRARLRALAPKLERAFLLNDMASDRTIRVDGEPLASGQERGISGGLHVIEATRSAATEIRLRFERLPLGRRSPLSRLDAQAGRTGRLDLTHMPAQLKRLTIDGYAVRAPLAGLEGIIAPVGTYELVVELEGWPTRRLQVHVTRFEPVHVADLVPPPAADRPAPPPRRTFAWKAGLIGAGAAAIGGGVALLMVASSERAVVTGAESEASDPRLVGLTYSEAVRIEGTSDDRATAGALLVLGGAVAAAGGVVWALLDGPRQLTVAPTAGGAVAALRF